MYKKFVISLTLLCMDIECKKDGTLIQEYLKVANIFYLKIHHNNLVLKIIFNISTSKQYENKKN